MHQLVVRRAGGSQLLTPRRVTVVVVGVPVLLLTALPTTTGRSLLQLRSPSVEVAAGKWLALAQAASDDEAHQRVSHNMAGNGMEVSLLPRVCKYRPESALRFLSGNQVEAGKMVIGFETCRDGG